MKKSINLITLSVLFTSCGLLEHRSFVSEMRSSEPFFVPGEDFATTPGDEGRAFRTSRDILRRTPGGRSELVEDPGLAQELASLENSQTDYDFSLYQKYQDQLGSTSEKIYFLSIHNTSDKIKYLEARGLIEKKIDDNFYSSNENQFARNNSEILLGMSKDDVSGTWGKPVRRDVAGNPTQGNERWSYYRNGVLKYIYFASGKVEGWSDGE